MREQWARRIALLTGQLVLLMAVLFAVMQNPIEPTTTTVGEEQPPAAGTVARIELDPKDIEAGFQVYQQQTCARCHSITGIGNSRNPLDGVGARRNAQALRDWIIGADVLQTVMPARPSI